MKMGAGLLCCLWVATGCRQQAPAPVIVAPAAVNPSVPAAANPAASTEMGAATSPEPAAVPMSHFKQGGVAFDYPAVWTKSAIAGGYLQ